MESEMAIFMYQPALDNLAVDPSNPNADLVATPGPDDDVELPAVQKVVAATIPDGTSNTFLFGERHHEASDGDADSFDFSQLTTEPTAPAEDRRGGVSDLSITKYLDTSSHGLLLPAVQDDGLLLHAVQDDGLLLHGSDFLV